MHIALNDAFWPSAPTHSNLVTCPSIWGEMIPEESDKENVASMPIVPQKAVRMGRSKIARLRRSNTRLGIQDAKGRTFREAQNLCDAGKASSAKKLLRDHQVTPPASLRDRMEALY